MGDKKKAEDELVDAGSEYSFPASDPPSYMGGSAVAGPPPQKEPPREPVSKTVSNPKEVKPAGDGLPDTKQGQADKTSKELSGGKKPDPFLITLAYPSTDVPGFTDRIFHPAARPSSCLHLGSGICLERP